MFKFFKSLRKEHLHKGFGILLNRYKRGPHLYILALAMSKVWCNFPQERLTASFIKLGYYSLEGVKRANMVSLAKVQEGIDDLDEARRSAVRKCAHAERDASGLPEESAYVVQSKFHDLPLQSQEDLLPKAWDLSRLKSFSTL